MHSDDLVDADTDRLIIYERETHFSSRYFRDPANQKFRHRKKTPPERVENDIHSFSQASRRRLMSTLRQVRTVWLSPPIFVRLGFHKKWPEHPYDTLRLFIQWLRRIHPGHFCFLWRLEWQSRGAPHFHLLMWERSVDSWFHIRKNWRVISNVWSYVCGEEGNEDHLRWGSHVQEITSYRKVLRYVSKYIAKVDETAPEKEGQRHWGRSADLPCIPVRTVRTAHQEFIVLRRIARRLMKSRRMKPDIIRRITQGSSFSLICDAPVILDLLAWLNPFSVGQSVEEHPPPAHWCSLLLPA